MKFAAFLLSATLASAANAATIDLYVTDTASPWDYSGTDTQNDNRLRAYTGSTGNYIDGWMKFDLSGLANNISITAMTLNLYAEGRFGAPHGSPQLQIFRSSFDAWTRGGSGFTTALDETLTAVDPGPFPGIAGTPYSFGLDVNAVNWAADLLDDTLSLVMRNQNTDYSYMYWFGSDQGNFRPTLSIEYQTSSVPLPAGLPLMLGGLAVLGLVRRRNKQA